MKFFVSGKIGDEAGALKAMDALRNAGHEITFDWTAGKHLKPYDENIAASRETAIRECRGVKDADILIIVVHDKGVGIFVELGIAIGLGIPIRVITTKPSRSMFFHHPLVKRVASIREVIKEFESFT